MAKKEKVTLDFTNFNRMMTHLSNLTGAGLDKIIEHELGKALSLATSRTKSANKGKIEKKYTISGSAAKYKEAEKDPSKYAELRSMNENMAPSIRIGSKKYKLPEDITSSNISMLKRAMRDKRGKKASLVGLAQASIAEAGYQTCSKHYTPTATATKCRNANKELVKSFVSSKVKKDPPQYEVTINCISLARGTNGDRTISTTLKGREQFMQTNLKKGVFDHAEKMASKYGFRMGS